MLLAEPARQFDESFLGGSLPQYGQFQLCNELTLVSPDVGTLSTLLSGAGLEPKCRATIPLANMSNWTEQRLRRLFDRYNRRFWRNRLRGVRISITSLEHLGEWDPKQREIRIDVDRHKGNDREIRSTLLHEICHVVATGPGHNSKFWAEIERLLRRKAPISVGFPETDGLQLIENAVPRRFPLARLLMNKVYRQQQRDLETEARKSGMPDLVVTDEDLIREFADSEIACHPWKRALRVVGSRYGLLDVDGKPKDKRSVRIITSARKEHNKARRELLESNRIKQLWKRGRSGNDDKSSQC